MNLPTFIIVANGFRVKGHYYIKELTSIHLRSDFKSFHITIQLPAIQDWTCADFRQVNYCRSNIHRLSWENQPSCLLMKQALELIQSSIQIEELCSPDKVIIGVKGDYELKHFLEKLGYCTVVDIEKDFQCPKAKEIYPSPLSDDKTCIFHQDLINLRYCSIYKARCYQKFLLDHLSTINCLRESEEYCSDTETASID